ncbi:hypothetical protein CEUSTIGMA_g14091.t1 [Chlamydomonas eustigma]|uniref:Uncharacterized protein n=1 Tax=Chlamydomonas eustigma TaxID=1157962 RepID=A0A250XUF5_9CHLO|nr:hypothetical protein CEUSTIGMA_g14091.t1 [Chlamydomonas eustigma]|eukprot:GAX86684.1 hypothetical protein CEUSTIGMA_g14091.t1 [Chlamydomonas eustigma]
MEQGRLEFSQSSAEPVDINLVDMTVREARKALTHQAIRRRSHSAHSRIPGLTDLGALWPALWSVNPLQHTPPPTASESQLRMYRLEGLEERWRQPLGDDHFPPEELDQLPAWMRPDLVQWATVPRSKTIIIADDPHGWSSTHPPRQLMKNWTRLRVAVIGAIWFTRCQRKDLPSHQHSFGSQTIALAASSLTDAIRRDWLRTTQDLRTLDNGFTCADWLRGHASIQRYSSFEKSWLSPPIFCSVTAENTSKRLSLHIPVPPFPATVRIDQPLDPTLLPSPAPLPRIIIPPRTGQGEQGPTSALLPGLDNTPRTGQGGQAPQTSLRNRLFASHDHEAGPSGLSLAEKR